MYTGESAPCRLIRALQVVPKTLFAMYHVHESRHKVKSTPWHGRANQSYTTLIERQADVKVSGTNTCKP